MRQLLLFVILSVAISIVGACQKSREPFLNADDSRDLQAISTYENKEFNLDTADMLTSAASRGHVKIIDSRTDKKTAVHNFDFVNYKADDPLSLTDNTMMLGRTNFNYKLKYVFSGNLLKVMKVAQAEDLSTDEVAASDKIDDGRYLVPVVSYTVKFYNLVKTRNDLNQETSKLETAERPDRSDSTHFKIDYNSKTRATFLSKPTVFPSHMFFGEDGKSSDWYFSFTVIGQNYKDNHDMLAAQVASDKYNRLATKVRAKKTEDKIIFYNLGVDERLAQNLDKNVANQATVLSIPVEFQDFRFKENGKTSSVNEEAYTEKPWDKRAYANFHLREAAIPGMDLKTTELNDVQIDDGYFSFTVKMESVPGTDSASGIVRFSFLNVNTYQENQRKLGANAYKPKVYFRDDQKLFGFFSTVPDYIQTEDQRNDENQQKHVLINRYNPTRTVVEYRLSQDAPEWMEEIVKSAETEWNEALTAAGAKFRLRTSDDKGKVLRGVPGDLRYSLINVFNEVDQGTDWEGIAMSLVDPNTGEVISSTANITLNDADQGSIQWMQYMLYNYLRAKIGLLDGAYVFATPSTAPDDTFNVAAGSISMKMALSKAGDLINIVGDTFGLGKSGTLAVYQPATKKFLRKVPVKSDIKGRKLTLANHSLFEDQFDELNGNISNMIATSCPKLKAFADKLHGQPASVIEGADAAQITKECALDISKPFILHTLLHEMGHTFGLRHNFYGSADWQNFNKWQSSSVMDYLDADSSWMTKLGSYDIAALRWGYSDQVQKSDGSVATVDATKSTYSQVGSQLHAYKYCTDEDLYETADDPMCAQFDHGREPTEIVQDLILKYDASVAEFNYRLDRAEVSSVTSLAYYRQQRYVVPMLHFYEKWRQIMTGYSGLGNEYLEKFDTPEKYNALLQTIIDPKRVGENTAHYNANYHQAADMIFDFLMRITFRPDLSCAAKRNIGDKTVVELFPLSIIQAKIFSTSGQTVTSCQDSAVLAYLKKEKQADFLVQIGSPYENFYDNLKDHPIDQITSEEVHRPLIAGLVMDRFLAIRALTDRHADLVSTTIHGVQPSFIDEAPYLAQLEQKIMSRLVKGVDLKDAGPELTAAIQANKITPVNSFSPNFYTEQSMLWLFIPQLTGALEIPGKDVLSNRRLEPYIALSSLVAKGEEPSTDLDCLKSAREVVCAMSGNTQVKKFIQKYRAIDLLRQAQAITPEAKQKFLDLMSPGIPAAGQGAGLTFRQAIRKPVEVMNQISDDDPLKPQLEILLGVFDTEATIFKTGTQKVLSDSSDEDHSKKELRDQADELLAGKVVDMAKKIAYQGPDSKLDSESVDTDYVPLDQAVLKTRVEKLIYQTNQDEALYHSSPEEFDSQSDLLMEAILTPSY